MEVGRKKEDVQFRVPGKHNRAAAVKESLKAYFGAGFDPVD